MKSESEFKQEFKPKNKTLKLKPTLEIVEDVEEQPIIEEPIEEKQPIINESIEEEQPIEQPINQLVLNNSEIKRDIPTYIDNNSEVLWGDKDYSELWNKLTPKFKQVLLSDHVWLEDYMHKCVNAKKQGKLCELFLPNFTPKITENGSIDTGNPVINLEIKSLGKIQKEILKGMIVESKDKDFKDFNSSLFTMLEKNIGYSKYL